MVDLARHDDLHPRSDVRAAQQLATLASLPSVAVTTVFALTIINSSPETAVAAAATLLLLNGVGLRAVSSTFDRERLVTDTR